MRPKTLVAGAVLTAVLALVALPGLAGSRTPSPEQSVPAVAFQALRIDANMDGTVPVVRPLDAAYRSAGFIASDASIVEPAAFLPSSTRPKAVQPAASATSDWKPPRYTLSGWATWYANGTTAMRLPRGTTIVICGRAGCVQRTVTDYGPEAGHVPVRIVDLMPSDFIATCGCGLWVGTQYVTVRVY